jgi:hypothetical protein
MTNYVMLFLLIDQLFGETNIATGILSGQVTRRSNFVTYCHVLFNRCVILFLSVLLFVLSISVMSLTSFQFEGPNEFKGPPRRQDVDVVCVGSFINVTDFQQNTLSSKYHIMRAKYFVSMQGREFKNSIRLYKKILIWL